MQATDSDPLAFCEMAFPILGERVPADNGYALYAAISRVLGRHLPPGVSVASLGGVAMGGRMLRLDREARLRLRTAPGGIGGLLPLAGRTLDVGGCTITIGVPDVRCLAPAPDLIARVVTIRNQTEPAPFLDVVRRQLAELWADGEASIPAVEVGPRRGEPMRKVVRVKGHAIIGYTVRIAGLSPVSSLILQARGIGGRRHMGCGVFFPARSGEGVAA